MLNEKDLRGIYVPVVTPFRTDGKLDLDAFRKYIEHLLGQEIQGLVVNGTTGESPTVSWEEVAALVQGTLDARKGTTLPIVVGTGTNATASTAARTEAAGRLGADAVLVVVPYYSRPSEEGILAHYREIARVGVPIIVYEVPYRTGVRLSADAMRKIMDLEGVIGLKDSSGSLELFQELNRYESKPVLCGEDILFHAMLSQGASGGILASANVRTDQFAEVCRLARAGKLLAAKKAFDPLIPLIRLLFREPNPAPLKWMLARQCLLSSDAVRLPMSPITPALQCELTPYLSEPLSSLGEA